MVANDDCVPSCWDLMLIASGLLREFEVDKVGRGASHNRALYSEHLSRNYFSNHTCLWVRITWNLISQVLLVLGLTEFVLGVEVDP